MKAILKVVLSMQRMESWLENPQRQAPCRPANSGREGEISHEMLLQGWEELSVPSVLWEVWTGGDRDRGLCSQQRDMKSPGETHLEVSLLLALTGGVPLSP